MPLGDSGYESSLAREKTKGMKTSVGKGKAMGGKGGAKPGKPAAPSMPSAGRGGSRSPRRR